MTGPDKFQKNEDGTPIPTRPSTPTGGNTDAPCQMDNEINNDNIPAQCSQEHASAAANGNDRESINGGSRDQKPVSSNDADESIQSDDFSGQSKAHPIIFKPLPADMDGDVEAVQCFKLQDGNRIRQVFLPASITNPEEIQRILKAAAQASSVMLSQSSHITHVAKEVKNPVVVVEGEPHLFRQSKPVGEMTFEERIQRIQESPLKKIPLPPINVYCLKELEVQEIVKNLQLRHDIVFDPSLQFRPNLDGDLGIIKNELADEYWNDVENEIYVYQKRKEIFNINRSRLVPMFNSIRDIIVAMVGPRDVPVVKNVLEPDTKIQGIITGSLGMTELSNWLYTLLKKYCAPMRDSILLKLSNKFAEAAEESSLHKFIKALRLLFHVLEIMKLDIANHQIRLLRPALITNTVEFERQYYQNILSIPNNKLKPSFDWFKKTYNDEVSKGNLIIGHTTPQDVYRLHIRNVLSFAACQLMVREYPPLFSFDGSRLLLLRSELRQVSCLMICRLLFKQLVSQDETLGPHAKVYVNDKYTDVQLKTDIISIVSEERGKCKWTKNTVPVALHLCKTIQQLVCSFNRLDIRFNMSKIKEMEKIESHSATSALFAIDINPKKVEFAKIWLSKQFEPKSPVYMLIEKRIMKSLEEQVFNKSRCTVAGNIKQDFLSVYSNKKKSMQLSTSKSYKIKITRPAENNNNNDDGTESASDTDDYEDDNNTTQLFLPIALNNFKDLISLVYTLCNFHWSVFGNHYIQSLGRSVAA